MLSSSTATTPWQNPLKGWYNKPESKVSIRDSKIIIRAPQGSDCWRKTRQGMITRTVNTAPFHWHKISGNFQAVVKISGNLAHDSDKAGLMIKLDDANWIFTGMEWYNECANHCTSVALDHTDWCIVPLPDHAEKTGIWFCFKRIKDCYETYYSVDAKHWILTRQGLFTNRPVLYVGIACACPSDTGFKAVFDSYNCTLLGGGDEYSLWDD